MFANFGFTFHLITIALAVRQFSRALHCFPSSSFLDISLAFLSLLPPIHAFALFLKESLVGGFLRLNGALAYVNHPDEDGYVFFSSDSGERCPGHLDTSECRTFFETSSRYDVSHESALSLRSPSAQCTGNEPNRLDGPLLLNPHVVARSQYARPSGPPPTNACPSTLPASNDDVALPHDSLPGSGLFADLELSALGRHLARHYGMFAWRIHPLIRAHNASVGLDASFRRLDMFMHSSRTGMLYHELIIFIDHTISPQELSGNDKRRATWNMYAARTRECALSDPSHTCFQPVDGGGCDGVEEWQNCLQWDALMARVLNTAYMRRAREAVVQRWDRDAWEYWTYGEGISQATADRVAKVVLAYGSESFPIEGEFRGVVSSGSRVGSGIQSHTRPALDRRDEFECVANFSSCPPDCDCGRDEDTSVQGAEVDSALYEFDFEEELCAQDWNVGRGLEFRSGGELGPESDFGSLDSILSDGTLPPASLTPSSSGASSSDTTLERILYPRLMRCSTPRSHQRESQLRTRLVRPSHTRIYPAAEEGSPTFATSGSSERVLADFSMLSLAMSTRTSTSMNNQDGKPSSSSSPRAGSGLTSEPAEGARRYKPSLLDLALALGTRGSEERLRERELTSSSSYPSPPPSPSPQHTQDSLPQVPEARTHNEQQKVQVVSESECKCFPPPSPLPFSAPAPRDNSRILTNNATCAAGRLTTLTEELTRGPPGPRMGSKLLPHANTTQSLHSQKKIRVTLNLTFNNPPSYSPPRKPAPLGPSAPRKRTSFSLWEAIMHPQGSPSYPSGPGSRLAGVDLPPNGLNNSVPSLIACDLKTPCRQAQPLDKSLGQGVWIDNEILDPGDGDCELIAGRSDLSRKMVCEDDKAARQRAGTSRRIRIEVTEALDTE
ncbi:hypothetical protein GSI_04822 [Ganoderma sinense ZZ0214-1]|uniref:Uncharacterized protein n=1 Tax=Ganoderma sinense ZZ0214-1 TaxID=1077348 RepID=A0A2G8SG82_9APHY|nr:hypothetical protein GSI_04822 [Ganoderma sinense ZZ0214-1]